MNAQRTSAEETERTLRAESVLSDDRLPKKTKPAHSGGKDRPRGKPFDEPERKYLCSLDIIDACTEKRITWNKTFIEYAEKELEAGSRPVDIFRGAGVGPELIGRKRIERCVARWRAKIKKEEQQ